MSPYSLLVLSQQGFYSSRLGTLHTAKEKGRCGGTGAKLSNVPRRKVRSNLRSSSAPIYYFPFGPEEEVFDLELEGVITEATETIVPDMESIQIMRGEVTPGPRNKMVIGTPPTPRARRASYSRDGCVVGLKTNLRTYKCEEVMEYAVDTFMWKRLLQSRYGPGDLTEIGTDITISARCNTAKWLVKLTRLLGYSLETLCLAINYLDRFLAIQPIEKDCLQLSGMTALFLAAKLEEIDPPPVDQLVKLCRIQYSHRNLIHMEVVMLARLQFTLLAPTSSFLLFHRVEVEQEVDWPEDLSRHLVEMCLCDEDLYLSPPSVIGQSVYTVIKGCDTASVREACLFCPLCNPEMGGEEGFIRELIDSCFQLVYRTILSFQNCRDSRGSHCQH